MVIFFYNNGSRGCDVLIDFVVDAELSIMSDGYNPYAFIGNDLKTLVQLHLRNTEYYPYISVYGGTKNSLCSILEFMALVQNIIE